MALGFMACEGPDYGTKPNTTIASLGTPESNEIWFTTSDGAPLMNIDTSAFDVPVAEILYSEYSVSVIRFEGNVTSIGANAFDGCFNLFNISLPNSVTEIGSRAFLDCKNMMGLTLGSGLRSCGDRAFDGCYNITSLHIPSIRSWCNISFASMTSNPLYYAGAITIEGEKIRNFTISSGVKSISQYAFAGYSTLTSITIPTSLESIGTNAFIECEGLSKVLVESVELWSNIDFENELANPLSIAGEIYRIDRMSLKEELVTELSLDANLAIKPRTFVGCTSITSLTTGDTVEIIGLEAFRGCVALKTISLGSNTAEIEAKAFMGCRVLERVECLALYPPLLNSNVFAFNAENRIFAVPSEALQSYLSNEQWSKYAENIEPITE